MNFGFVRVAAVVPSVNVADCRKNTENIINTSREVYAKGARVIVFPELSITSYTCGDLFGQSLLLEVAQECIGTICAATKDMDAMVVVGAPLRKNGILYNCAVVLCKGQVLGVIPKSYIPNYKEFYEKRWFASGKNIKDSFIKILGESVPFGVDLMFASGDAKIAVEICEDLWTPIPPSSYAASKGANILLNLSASNELIGKHNYLVSLLKQQSARCIAGYVYASSGFGESTTDVVFAGNAMIFENGSVMATAERFSLNSNYSIADIDVERLNNERRVNCSFGDNAQNVEAEYRCIDIDIDLNSDVEGKLLRTMHRQPFVPSDDKILNDRCEEIINIQVEGLMRRLAFTGIKSVVIGVSGGLDSTLALLVAHRAFIRLGYDTKGIYGITMPGFGTTDRTYTNALDLMCELDVTIKEIPISESVIQHFKDIEHDINVHDTTYENCQARERTQILMDYSNKCNGLVVGTGDLSELALGWATYNGDHMSMYAVNVSIPKTLVKYLVRWFAMCADNSVKDTLLDIVDTPISPELIPADENGNIKQKTEDLVGPYELHDFFLYYVLRHGFSPKKIYYLAQQTFEGAYSDDIIKKWLRTFFRRFFQQQFKRSCLPDGPKVGSVSLSPRGDWRMPSDASAALWLEECDKL